MSRKKCSFKSRTIYQDLRKQIEDGTLPPNTKLPSAPELAARYGVAKMTLYNALSQLAKEGLVSSRQYHGTWVSDPSNRKTTKTIGLIVPGTRSNLTHSVFSRFVNGIEGVASAEGYVLAPVLSDPDNPNTEKVLHARLERKDVSGWIVPCTVSEATRKILGILRPPSILLHFPMPEVSGHLFLGDEGISADIINHAWEQGYRKPCLVYPSCLSKSYFLENYQSFLKQRGVANSNVQLFQEASFGRELGFSAARAMLDSAQRPDLFVCEDDDVAFAIMQVLAERGLQAPEIGLIGAGNFPASTLVDPPLTTTRLPYYQVGREITRLLVDILQGHKVEEITRTFSIELLVRQSSRRKSDAFGDTSLTHALGSIN